MTSKSSRTALIAAIAVGVSGLVAVPAEAANGISTDNYYVNQPAVTGVTNVTPESAVLNGAIDTGGSPMATLTVGSGDTLTWANAALLTSGSYDIDGLPANGSADTVNVKITDAAGGLLQGLTSGTTGPVSNAGADNYSQVLFEYDPVADYVASGDAPGPETQYADEVNVPTAPGLSAASVQVGAFGITAQNNTGETPLTPDTKYYYWIQQQPGVTDATESINIAQWVDQALPNGTSSSSTSIDANPTYKCYPLAAIEADPTLASYNSSTMISPQTFANGVTMADSGSLTGPQPAIQPGGCPYDYGDTSGAIFYDSPVGEFQTPAVGSLKLAKTGVLSGNNKDVIVAVTDSSNFKAGGTIELKVGGKLAASGKFNLLPNATANLKLKLTKLGLKDTGNGKTAKVVLSSNYGQTTATKSIRL